jgi:hypothetical protein
LRAFYYELIVHISRLHYQGQAKHFFIFHLISGHSTLFVCGIRSDSNIILFLFPILFSLSGSYGLNATLDALQDSPLLLNDLIHSFLVAFVALYVACERPPYKASDTFDETNTATTRHISDDDWARVARAAIVTHDDHKIKGAFVLREYAKWVPQHATLFFRTAELNAKNLDI